MQGFFAASEMSSISSSLLKLRHRSENGDEQAAKVYARMIAPESFLVTILVGINISLVLSSSFLTLFLIHFKVERSNLWMMLCFSPLVVIFGELIPKNIGRHFREDYSLKTLKVYVFFERLLKPLVSVIEVITNFLIKAFVGKVRRRSLFVTKEELGALVKDIEASGGIDKGETQALEEVLEFRQQKISDAYLDIKKVIAIDYNADYAMVLAVIKQAGFTRYPVFKESGEVAGYINIFDLFFNSVERWQNFIRPLNKVGLEDKLYDVFNKMKTNKENIALVVSGNKICGLATFQDLIKEIVASIVK